MTPKFKDRSTAHCTTLETRIRAGRRSVTLSASVVGRDLWAYQTAKIELQAQEIAQRRAQRAAAASSSASRSSQQAK